MDIEQEIEHHEKMMLEQLAENQRLRPWGNRQGAIEALRQAAMHASIVNALRSIPQDA